MSDYQAGKDMANFEREIQVMQGLVQQLYEVVEYNIKTGKIDEPKPEEKKK